MDINTCYATTAIDHTIAYYSHLVPMALALLLAIYALAQTKFSKLSIIFFGFVFSFCLWLAGDLVDWVVQDYGLVYFTWSWLDFVNIVFYVLGAYFFAILARQKITLGEKIVLGLLCVPGLVITVLGQSVVEFNQAVCEAANSDLLTNYKLFAEGAASLLALGSLVVVWRRSDVRKRIQLCILLLAILLFFAVFGGTEYIASITAVYEVNLYGLFVLPLFLLILTFAITDLRLFQLRFVGTQILAYVLVILVGSELLFIQDSTSRNLTLITLAMSLLIALFLIENARREALARIRIEELAKDLQKANDQQVTLIHFITHQIKGFLTKSRGVFAGLMEGDYGVLPDTMKDIVKMGFDSDTKGVDTVQEILGAANIKSGKVNYTMAPFDLKALIDEIVTGLKPNADAKKLALTESTDEGSFTVNGDRTQLVNVFKNLIDNSIKYTPQGSVNVSLAHAPGKIVFKIQDTGVGITPEDMKNLFTEGGHGKESQKINTESTGFGLYIVKNIVEAHKGKVWAESDGADKGSRFIVELPS